MGVKIKIDTLVNQSLEEVKSGFDQHLFLKLNPPFPKVKLQRFDGCLKGDIVSLELNFILFKQLWISEIVEDESSDDAFYFVDEGTKMPAIFKYWRHKHLLSDKGGKTEISDNINYRTPFIILDWLLYPFLYLQFKYRKPIYRKVFG